MLSKTTIQLKELQELDLSEYDIINIKDDKSDELKGIFVSSKYLPQINELLNKLNKKNTEKLVEEFEAICGIGEIGEISIKEALKRKE